MRRSKQCYGAILFRINRCILIDTLGLLPNADIEEEPKEVDDECLVM